MVKDPRVIATPGFEPHRSRGRIDVGDECVASVLRFDVSPAERLVAEAGDGAAVRRLYDATELSLEAPLSAAVERTTGRRVLAFQTSMSPEHGLIVEAFVLAPAAA
jgi:uncharacterized protein YbcI